MTTIFAQALKDESRFTYTENGAVAYNTTDNALVDLFAVIGGMRHQDPSRLNTLIESAYNENPLLLAKMIFQTRDVRGGLGERDIFRHAINYCAIRHPDVIRPNIHLIPEYGRWDDMFCLIGTPLENDMFSIVRKQLDDDAIAVQNGGKPSLLAKWLPTGDATSVNTRRFAKTVAKGMGYADVREYKRAYRPIRAYLNTTERKMALNQWTDIDYEHVPSRAMSVHNPAFHRHDEKGFMTYLNEVWAGEKKINSSTLYPYDIVEKALYHSLEESQAQTLDLQWKALPNYINGERNFLVMADVSGSMMGRPIATSIGLAIYFAQRNKGAYHNMFMTFSEEPEIVRIRDGNLIDTVRSMQNAKWGFSTNLEAGFRRILDVAVKSHCSQEDLPEALIIITDMEFNAATMSMDRNTGELSKGDMTFMDSMRQLYKDKGYEMPGIVFWNVQSRHDTYHDSADVKGMVMVSGQSASTFAHLTEGLNGKTAYEMMIEYLNDKRYDPITVSQ